MVERRTFTVLGIETSCDETAAAIVRGHPDRGGKILSDEILSQLADHAPYKGVVPEIAARAHIRHLDKLVVRALAKAKTALHDLDAIAATAGPGLIGGVIVGLMTGKGLALAGGKSLVAINHLEAHALSARLQGRCGFPFLLLLVSGGHTQLVAVKEFGHYRLYGTTIDDAVGEAFDKTAMLLGLPLPGGPALEKLAEKGNARRFSFPRPLLDREGMNFSLSGLKTAVRYALGEFGVHTDALKADIAASFQAAIVDVLCDRARHALGKFSLEFGKGHAFVVSGGVAANRKIRAALSEEAAGAGFAFLAPPPELCTDNAAMIAWAGIEHLARGRTDSLAAPARARWPLAELERHG